MGEDGIDFQEMFFTDEGQLCPKKVENLETEKYFASNGMRKFGGSFVKALGEALAHADPVNTKKIMITWPDYWKKYADLGHKEELAGDLGD